MNSSCSEMEPNTLQFSWKWWHVKLQFPDTQSTCWIKGNVKASTLIWQHRWSYTITGNLKECLQRCLHTCELRSPLKEFSDNAESDDFLPHGIDFSLTYFKLWLVGIRGISVISLEESSRDEIGAKRNEKGEEYITVWLLGKAALLCAFTDSANESCKSSEFSPKLEPFHANYTKWLYLTYHLSRCAHKTATARAIA